MAGNVYSTYELARKMANERMRELEQDIFICHTKFRSGEEFVLKTTDQVFGDYLYMLPLPLGYHFKDKKNAQREADKFKDKLNKNILVETITYEENGYTYISHYSLKSCST